MTVFLHDSVQAFARKVREHARTLPGEAVRKVQKVHALQFLRGVVLKTPVDTGRARANWQLTVGAPAETVREGGTGFRKESRAPMGDEATADVIEARDRAALDGLPIFGVVFVSNNVVYIVFLEEGTDKMPPVGMAALTFRELLTQFG